MMDSRNFRSLLKRKRAITGLDDWAHSSVVEICAGILFFTLYGHILVASGSSQCPAIPRNPFHHNGVQDIIALDLMLTFAILHQLLES